MNKIQLIEGIADVESGFLADKNVDGKVIFLIEDKADEKRGIKVAEFKDEAIEQALKNIEAKFPKAKFEVIKAKEEAAASN